MQITANARPSSAGNPPIHWDITVLSRTPRSPSASRYRPQTRGRRRRVAASWARWHCWPNPSVMSRTPCAAAISESSTAQATEIEWGTIVEIGR